MEFLSALVLQGIKFVIMGAMAVGMIILGAKVKKMKQNSASKESEE